MLQESSGRRQGDFTVVCLMSVEKDDKMFEARENKLE